ncbi:hypothetical protein KKA85_08645 [bacterium]|nr:hypothetical protein [bacterium]
MAREPTQASQRLTCRREQPSFSATCRCEAPGSATTRLTASAATQGW